MPSAKIELMHDQVRAIYRAATGTELSDNEDSSGNGQDPPPNGDVEQRFAELDALVRLNPAIGERVPPFSFTPLVDIIECENELIVQLAAPGVERGDVQVESTEQELVVSGIRRGQYASNGRAYVLAEIPRGPFSRVIRLPCAVEPQAELEVLSGVIVVRLRKA